ncbi:MAG TPA: type II toxin-antitoxin system PemK/MazF family toxin [Acidimicrobiales bacterium]
MSGLGHGQIWWADLDKVRPVLVLTRATVAPYLTRVVVAPITSVKRDIPTEVPLGTAEGVADGSVANFDNLQLVPVSRLLRRAGRISDDRWHECCEAAASMMAC